MGLWSMSISFSIASYPVSFLYFPGLFELRLIFCAKAFFKISFTNVDFPEPDTPVTAINFPRGKSTLTFFKLFSAAPVKRMDCPFPARRSAGVGISRFPERYCPVSECSLAATSSGVPAATISPPACPAPGPTSIK